MTASLAHAFRLTCLVALLAVAGTATASPSDPDSLARYEGFLVTRVDITGYVVTKPYVVRREIRIQPGDTFHVASVRADRVRLENLEIFSSMVVTGIAADSTVALTYTVKETPWLVPYPRVTYTEADGFSAGLGVASVNLFGRAAFLSGYFLLGGVNSFALAFRYPWITGNHVGVDVTTADLTREDELNDFREHSREIAPWFGRWIGDAGRVAATVSYFQMNSDRDGITLSPDRRDQFLRLGMRVGYDTRDSWRSPRSGWNNEFLFMWSDGGAFGEPGQWPLFEIDVRRYLKIASGQSITIGSLTSLQTGTVGESFPEYLQYRMGGANSIRGYKIDTLGRELYGTRQWIVTTEYRHAVVPLREFRLRQWSVSAGLDIAGFVDWGTAWSSTDEFGLDRAHTGGGIGLRFLLPAVLEIRTDVAIGSSGDIILHLGVGDKLNEQRARLR